MGGLHILNHEPTGEQAETTRAGRPLLPVPRVPGGAAQAPGLQAPARLRPPAATWESAASNNRINAREMKARFSSGSRVVSPAAALRSKVLPSCASVTQMASRLVCDQKTV